MQKACGNNRNNMKKAAGYLAVSDILLNTHTHTHTHTHTTLRPIPYLNIRARQYKNYFLNNIHISNSNGGKAAIFFRLIYYYFSKQLKNFYYAFILQESTEREPV
jgi:hypothetical protein